MQESPLSQDVLSGLDAPAMPEAHRASFERILTAYAKHCLGNKRNTRDTVNRYVRIVLDFGEFCQGGPWTWTEDHFESYCYMIAYQHADFWGARGKTDLGRYKNLSPQSQRTYQQAIRSFLKYAVGNQLLQNEVFRKFRSRIDLIAHDENCIPHKNDHGNPEKSKYFTRVEIYQLFEGLDNAREEAKRFRLSNLMALTRDRALFTFMYGTGARLAETCGLDIDDFRCNDDFPELGDFGIVHVVGKGSKGSGPKPRDVIIVDHDVSTWMEWYLAHCRPYLAAKGDPNERAMFLSERGTRLSKASINDRLRKAMDYADINYKGRSPHTLRHSYASHMILNYSLPMVQRNLGHVHAATTNLYAGHETEQIRRETNRAIQEGLRRARTGT